MKTVSSLWRTLFCAAVIVVPFAPAALAQDPPSRVARLNYINGSVSFQPAGVDDWASADVNRPLTTGDRLYTDNGGRAELQIGNATLRLNGQASMSFLNLDDHVVQIELSGGSLSFRVRRYSENETFEIDTPNVAFTVLRRGEYRVDANPDGQSTLITVRSGEGEATGGGQSFTVQASQQVRFGGTSQLSYDVSRLPSPDGFDNWSTSRDVREDRSESARYVSPDMIGYEDLDQHGRWSNVAGYGPVWRPANVGHDWAPYHDGHWAWIAPWGWTWVDDQPWGFAPSHYGRWAHFDDGWGWVPGPVVVQPVYSPALVVFVGGPTFGTSVSFGGGGGVGWFPLGPGEPYIPAYRASPTYIRTVNNTVNTTIVNNITNTTVVNNTTVNNYNYANQAVPGAVTAVPTQTFVNARPVAATAVRVPPSAVQAAHVVVAAPVAPVQSSVLGAGAGRSSVATPPATMVSRQVVAKTAPPPPPVPFAKQQQSLAAQPGRPLEKAALSQIQPAVAVHPAVKMAPPASPAANKPPSPTTAPAPADSRSTAVPQKQAEQQKQLEQQKQAEQQRQADQQRQGEQQKQAEQQRQADQQKQAGQQRQAEQQKQAEQQRQPAQQAQAEQQRQATQQKQAEQQKQAAQQTQAEQQRQAAQQAQAAQQKQAEQQRQAEQQKPAPPQKQTEQQKQAPPQKQTEQQRQEEQKKTQKDKQKTEPEKPSADPKPPGAYREEDALATGRR